MAKRIALVWHVLLPLAVGALLYLKWPAARLVAHGWLSKLGMSAHIAARSDWLRTELPGFLWVYAFVFAVAIVWFGAPRRVLALWLSLPLLLSATWEFGQLAGLLPGTFAAADLIAYGLAGSIALPVSLRLAEGGCCECEVAH